MIYTAQSREGASEPMNFISQGKSFLIPVFLDFITVE